MFPESFGGNYGDFAKVIKSVSLCISFCGGLLDNDSIFEKEEERSLNLFK
tara:strand:- start:275 stop:424 length:150 start_codon:yes stop_codon:yes gene_type:complete